MARRRASSLPEGSPVWPEQDLEASPEAALRPLLHNGLLRASCRGDRMKKKQPATRTRHEVFCPLQSSSSFRASAFHAGLEQYLHRNEIRPFRLSTRDRNGSTHGSGVPALSALSAASRPRSARSCPAPGSPAGRSVRTLSVFSLRNLRPASHLFGPGWHGAGASPPVRGGGSASFSQ